MELDTSISSTHINFENFDIECDKKLSSLKIFIYGMRGLGVVIAKNTILQFPKAVTIYDDSLTTVADLGSNPYLSSSDVGKTSRADGSIIKLKDLSQKVNVNVYKGELAYDFTILKGYDVVVISELIARGTAESLNIFCRENKIGFIYCACLGLCVFSFTDFGEDFITKDSDGEESMQYQIKNITRNNPGIVTIDSNNNNCFEKIQFSQGDYVCLREIIGMTELNDTPPRPIRVLSEDTFLVEDTSKFSEYISGGVVERVKIPKPFFFKSLKECFENINNDDFEFFSKMNARAFLKLTKPSRLELLHLSFLSLHDFLNKNNRLPYLNSKDDADKIIEISKLIYMVAKDKKRDWALNLTNIEEYIIYNVVMWSRAQIPFICSYLGGIVSQEILKIANKYTPFNQWFIFDFFDTFNISSRDETNIVIDKTSKYQEQIAIFGNNIADKLNNLNVNINNSNNDNENSAAISKNLIDIFSLMGVKYNISLFENNDKTFNDSNNVDQLNSSENNLKIEILNLLDNENEELNNNLISKFNLSKYNTTSDSNINNPVIYINTYGLKAISGVVMPNLTCENKNISDFISDIINSSLKSFETLSEHCTESAKKLFNSIFNLQIVELNSLLFLKAQAEEEDEDEEDLIYSILDKLVKHHNLLKIKEKLFSIKKLIEIICSNNFEKCVEYAIFKFIEVFNHKVKQIIIKYPVESTNDDGCKFWSNAKRCPTPVSIDLNDPNHLNFIKTFAILLSKALNIEQLKDQDYFNITKINIKIGELKNNNIFTNNDHHYTRTSLNNKNLEQEQEKEIRVIKEIIISFILKLKQTKHITPVEENIESKSEFIIATAEIKAQTYKVKETDFMLLKNQRINSRSVSSQSCISGLSTLQIYSYIINSREISGFRNYFINLGTGLIIEAEPTKKH